MKQPSFQEDNEGMTVTTSCRGDRIQQATSGLSLPANALENYVTSSGEDHAWFGMGSPHTRSVSTVSEGECHMGTDDIAGKPPASRQGNASIPSRTNVCTLLVHEQTDSRIFSTQQETRPLVFKVGIHQVQYINPSRASFNDSASSRGQSEGTCQKCLLALSSHRTANYLLCVPQKPAT